MCLFCSTLVYGAVSSVTNSRQQLNMDDESFSRQSSPVHVIDDNAQIKVDRGAFPNMNLGGRNIRPRTYFD